jgi:glycosyltransferase involved in cell wall biosynthesis
MPTVSVVINSFNSVSFLADAIRGVLQQTYKVNEIIISDVSNDSSVETIRHFASQDERIKPVFGSNKGQLSTIYSGLQAASGDIIFLLDGDDFYEPDHVFTILQYFQDFPQANLVYCRHKLCGKPAIVEALKTRQDHENAQWMGPFDLERPYDWGCSTALAWCDPDYHGGGVNSTISIRRSHAMELPLANLCEALGGQVMANADYTLLLASALYGGRKVYAPCRTVNYRVHGSSLTGRYALSDLTSDYQQRRNCAIARNWLCSDRRFGPALFELLDKEMQAVPSLSWGHRRMYKRAKRRQHHKLH